VKVPLSHPTDPDSEHLHPIIRLDGAPSRRSADKDGWLGLAHLTVAALLVVTAVYGTDYVAEYLPATAPPLRFLSPLASLGFGVWLARRGVANPYVRKFERWRSRAQDWREQALDAKARSDESAGRVAELEALLDEAAQYVTHAYDPKMARRLLQERLDKQKAGKRRGRPPRTPNGVTYEEAVKRGREIRKLLANGMSWSNAAKRFAISVEAARLRVQWADEEDAQQMDSA
jgi:hypothetical protein